jgi:hypothetical protein
MIDDAKHLLLQFRNSKAWVRESLEICPVKASKQYELSCEEGVQSTESHARLLIVVASRSLHNTFALNVAAWEERVDSVAVMLFVLLAGRRAQRIEVEQRAALFEEHPEHVVGDIVIMHLLCRSVVLANGD